MTLSDKLKRRLEFDEDAFRTEVRPAFLKTFDEDMVNGALQYHARLAPWHALLVECVEDLERSVSYWFGPDNRAHAEGIPEICCCLCCNERKTLAKLTAFLEEK